ncbi:MAG: amidohydrolase [Lautropia sp.]
MKQDHLQPSFRAPAGACDCHFHVFGAHDRYPARDPKLRYPLPYAPLESYLETARRLGLERFVVVQPSAYLRDNSCLEETLRELGTLRARGIVDIGEDVADAELARLHALGVRGVRINVSPVHPFEEGLADRLLGRIDRMEARCKEIGWQLDFLLPGWLTEALLDRMARLEVDFTMAHMGMFLAARGPQQPGFVRLLDLLRHGSGHAHVKLTGVYRMSKTEGFTDARPMVHALLEAAPDRLLWGSDDPHASFADKVGSVELFNLLGDWVPDESLRRRILAENPARLFGF